MNKIVLPAAELPKPAVALVASDYERLFRIATLGLERSPDVAEVLLEEPRAPRCCHRMRYRQIW
jgi:hypothetical protein